MNKKAFMRGYNQGNPQIPDTQVMVILGFLAKEAGLVIPQEEVDVVLNTPMDKTASENIGKALFLKGYTMDKNADIGEMLMGAGERYMDVTGKLPPNLRHMVNPIQHIPETISKGLYDIDMARLNRGATPGLSKAWSGALDTALAGTGLPALSKGVDTKRMAARRNPPWYNQIWDWIKENPWKAGGVGLGGAYLLNKLLGGRRQQAPPPPIPPGYYPPQYPAYR